MHICEVCGVHHNGDYGSGRFCGLRCSKSRRPSVESNLKRTQSLKKRKTEISQRVGHSHYTRLLLANFEQLSTHLKKKRIIQEQNGCCKICGITEWQQFPINLQLDHIDGDGRNNQYDNLRAICPNCHSQTDTYTGRNNVKQFLVGSIGVIWVNKNGCRKRLKSSEVASALNNGWVLGVGTRKPPTYV